MSKMNTKFLVLGATAVLYLSTMIARADLVFDNMTAYQGGNGNAHVTSTGSTPNTFMGGAYTLAPGTTTIAGFDLYPVNLSGTAYDALKISMFVWGGVNTSGTVNVTTAAGTVTLATGQAVAVTPAATQNPQQQNQVSPSSP